MALSAPWRSSGAWRDEPTGRFRPPLEFVSQVDPSIPVSHENRLVDAPAVSRLSTRGTV